MIREPECGDPGFRRLIQQPFSTPHRYDLTRLARAGDNTLTVRVDNRQKLDIGIGHAYTEETQTIWNGLIGRLELRARPRARIEAMRLRTDLARGGVAVTVEFVNSGLEPVRTNLRLQASPAGFSQAPRRTVTRRGRRPSFGLGHSPGHGLRSASPTLPGDS